jgi:hypothetical protein
MVRAMSKDGLAAALAALALFAPAAQGAVTGPVTALAAAGERPHVLARADGSAVAAWESGASVTFCRIAAGAAACAAGSEKLLAPAAPTGATTSRPFVFDLSGGRIVVVRGECCPQHTYRWISADNGATFAAAVDFASVVPADQGAAVGPGDAISLLGDPARYQLAPATTASKTTAEATLDTSAGLTGGHAVSVDPAANRPIALWGTAADAFASGAATASPNLSSSWPARTPLAGVTGMRLSGAVATWVRGGRHEIARWASGSFGAGVPLAFAAADAGEADVATDPAGGVHVVYSPPGTGNVCYARVPVTGPAAAPVLLGGDSDGVAGLQVSASGDGQGRVVFSTPAAGGPVSVLPLASASLSPNTCGLPPAGVLLAKAAKRSSLNAALDPAGQDTSYFVEYGPTTAYGTRTPAVMVEGTGGPVAATVDLGPLTPGQRVHARLVATNPTGTVTTGDVTFRTPGLTGKASPQTMIRFARRCVRGRLRVELRALPGARPVLALLEARGRKPVRLGRQRLRAGVVTLTRLPRRHVTIAVRLRLADGRIIRRARDYEHC